MKKKVFFTLLLVIVGKVGVGLIENYEQVLVGKLAANQFNPSDTDFLVLQSASQNYDVTIWSVYLLIAGLLFLIWRGK